MTARALALDVLLDIGREFAWGRLDAALRQTQVSSADRGLATELVYGSLRRRGSLDFLLHSLTNDPQRTIQPFVWELLRLGGYQLIYLDQIPPHAAIFETVELAKTRGHARATGFINGVLRNLDRLLTKEMTVAPARDALPLTGHRYRRLTRPVLPDPQREPSEYLSAGLSLPRWLVDRWLSRYGWDETLRLGFWFAEPGPLWVRVNSLRTTRDDLREQFALSGYTAEAGRHPQSLRLKEHAPIRSLPGFAEGLFAVQDHSAMTVATALAPEPDMTILDMCAAPGGKTTHLAELMNDTGRIVARDVDERRLSTVNELCGRLGVTIVETALLASGVASAPRVSKQEYLGALTRPRSPELFDAALVDVPCSNTGVMGRRPEVRWRLTPKDFVELVQLQTKLLLDACAQVRPGGAVVYSTCSIETEENGGVVRKALDLLTDWSLESEQEHRAGQPADGGFWARLRRSL